MRGELGQCLDTTWLLLKEVHQRATGDFPKRVPEPTLEPQALRRGSANSWSQQDVAFEDGVLTIEIQLPS